MRRLLLCPPDYYGIEYEINPWMDKTRQSVPGVPQTQWKSLHDKLKALGCEIELVAPQRGLPDMVFTANAGLAVGRKFIRSNFRHKERRGEEEHFDRWFAAAGYELLHLPEKLLFEGEGDALFSGDVLFCGYHFRSDIRSHRWIAEKLGCLVISVELVMDRFYHLDTCFCPLPDGGVMWFPGAFDAYAARAIREHVKYTIEVELEEAMQFACNAVVLEKDIVLPEGCPKLYAELGRRGFRTHPLAMTEFLKAGGACKCLTMFLPQREAQDATG